MDVMHTALPYRSETNALAFNFATAGIPDDFSWNVYEYKDGAFESKVVFHR
jgi:hypothetical protein